MPRDSEELREKSEAASKDPMGERADRSVEELRGDDGALWRVFFC
jgi:hypothetical protein